MLNNSQIQFNEEELYLDNNNKIALRLNKNGSYAGTLVEIPLWYHFTVSLFLTSLGINGTLLNGLVLRHFWNRRMGQTSFGLILINLSFVELMIALVGAPFDVIALMQNGWRLGKYTCIADGLIVTTAGFVSILTLCVLSVFGYGSVFHISRKNQQKLSFTASTKIICLVWLCSLSLSLPPIFGWGRYVPELSGLGCAPDWHSEQISMTYIVYILVFGFLIPTIIIAVSSILTYVEAKKPRLSLLSNTKKCLTSNENRINVQLVIAMNIAYLTCWSPYAIICIIHVFISKSMIGPMLSVIPTITVKISVCANPLLYIAYNPNFNSSTGSLEIHENIDEEMSEIRSEMNELEYTQTSNHNIVQSLRTILQDTFSRVKEGQYDCEHKVEKIDEGRKYAKIQLPRTI